MATQDISQLVVEVKSQGIQTAANQLDKLATASDKAEASVKRLGTSVVGVNGVLTGGVAQTAALVAAMTTLTAVLDRVAASQSRHTVTTRRSNEAMAEAHALARGLSGSLGALWVTYGNLAGMGVGIALGASLKGVVTTGAAVEQTLEQIRVLGQASTGDIEKMSSALIELGKGTQGPKEVAEAFQVLTLAGLNAKQAMDAVGAALDLSVAGGVSVEKSSETLVQVGTALGYTAKDYAHVGDTIAKTAAVSMSSVDSISNAFKSAAAVGEVYGATLQDIALGLAAVANLGIQGTSAGTALKNFYKDLSASTQKVTGTLQAMKLSISDFRDANGFMLPLLDVVKKLDEGFGRLDQKQKKLAEVKMFSQQGAREYAVLNKLLHTASEEVDLLTNKLYASKLDEMADQINRAAGFATLAAIALTQTSTNQMKSVANTLQTTFVEVFKDIAPQLGDVARAMKSAFASPEFKAALISIATGIADITKFVVENAKEVAALAGMWWGGLRLVAFASTLTAVAGGFNVAKIAAAGFNAMLGPIGITITALTAAWALYKLSQDDALNNNAATRNLQEYNEGVIKAAQKEQEILKMRQEGKSETDIARATQISQDKEAADLAIKNSQRGLDAMKKELDAKKDALGAGDRTVMALMSQGIHIDVMSSKLEDYLKREKDYNKALEVHTNNVGLARTATQKFMEMRAANAKLADEQAKKDRDLSKGDGVLPGKTDKAAQNDAYAAAIQGFQNDIKASYKDLANFRESEDAQFRAGQIGRLQMIEETANKEIATYQDIAEAAEKQRDLAAKTPNKTADVARFQGEMDRAYEQSEQAERMRKANRLVAEREMLAQTTALRVKALEDEGHYVEANNLKWSSDGKIALERAESDLKLYGDRFPWLAELVKQFAATRDAAMNSAQLKEDALAFNTAMIEVQATLKGIKGDTAGGSVSGLMDRATKATAEYNKAMSAAKVKLDALKKDAAGGNPEAVKAYQEANKAMLAETDKFKTMWVEVGQTITSSLKDAFGAGGEALGKLNEAMIAYNTTENASAEDRMKQYGDMAQAASGFFDKQSKGYRALNGIAQVFHVAQMARTLVQTAASVAAGAAQFFAQSGWAGFAGVAAMGAVMAGLGYAMSGASGHGADPKLDADYVQKHQGTGSVLGDADAKSKSITDSIDILKSNSSIMLPLTQGMLQSLKNIESAMKGLAGLVVRGGVNDASNMNIKTGVTGNSLNPILATLMGVNAVGGAASGAMMGAMFGPLGMAAGALIGAIGGKLLGNLWGKTSQSIVDSGLQFGGKVSDLKNGQGIDQYAAVKTDSSSWFGLSKSSSTSVQTQGVSGDISRQFGLVFSNLEDAMKGAASSLGTNSDAVGKAIDNVVLQTTKVSLKDLKGQELTDAINNVMSAAMDQIAKAAYPQMTAFQQVGEGYAQTVIRVATGVEQADAALKKFGITAINYNDVQNKQGDVAFEIAKQSILACEGLSNIGSMLKDMTGTIDDLTTAYKALTDIRTQMNLIGLHGDKMNLGTITGAGGVSQLQTALNSYQDKYFTDQEKAAIMLKSVTSEFNKLGVALPTSKAALRALIEETSKSNPELTGQLLALADAYAKTVDAADTARNDQISGLQDTIDALKKFADALKSFKDSLALGDMSILTPTEKYLEAKRQYEDTVTKAMAGDATAQAAYTGVAQAYLDASRTVNASSQGYTDTYNQVLADIDKLGSATAGQLTNAEKQLEALQAQVSSLNALNVTATGIQESLNNLTAVVMPAPTTASAPMAVDTSALEAKMSQLITEVAGGKVETGKLLVDLMSVVFEAQTKGANVIAEAVTDSVKETAWAAETGKTLMNER